MNDKVAMSVSYALDFASFILLERDVLDKIISIYLFGSAARNELDTDSDIDIFINCSDSDEDFVAKSAETARKKFMKSRDFEKWKIFGFTYAISIKSGQLKDWELFESIQSEGIEIFSKNVQQNDLEKIILFSFEIPKSKKTYLKIRREIFGRLEKHYKSEGMVTKHRGKCLASNIFVVPKTSQSVFIDFMHKNKIKFSMQELLRRPL
jgi:predicted nucleotidyltransferase